MIYRKMKRQSRAKAMLPAIKELITIRALEDMEKDRTLLAHELREEIKAKFPQEIAPVVDTIIKKISEARNHAVEPLDEAWHLGMSEKYPLSAEAIPYILKVKEADPHYKVTIRQAIWINRLHVAVKDIKLLSAISWYYTFYEKIYSISKIPFSTAKYDVFLTDNKKQKLLVESFVKIEELINFSYRKKVIKQMTGMSMADPVFEIVFRDNDAFIERPNKPDYNYGSRDEVIKFLIKLGEIKKAEEIPDGDFRLKLKTNFSMVDKED